MYSRTENAGSASAVALRKADGSFPTLHSPEQKGAGEASAWVPSRFVRVRNALVVACLAGTGGLHASEAIRMPSTGANIPQEVRVPELVARQRRAMQPAAVLDRVKGFFKFSMTDISLVVGVTRQALYNWMAGQPVAERNIAKLEELGDAADLLERQGISISRNDLARKISGGTSFLDLLKSVNAVEAAQKYAADHSGSVDEREWVASRAVPRHIGGSSLGIPYYPNEREA